MSDLLDVLHYLFEEDQVPMEESAREARDNLRVSIYEDLYGYPKYTWVSPKKSGSLSDSGSDSAYTRGVVDAPVDSPAKSTSLTHKPYVPATPMDVDSPLPIAGIKEAPLG